MVAVIAVAIRFAFAPQVPPLLNPDSEGYVLAGWDLLHGNGLELGLRRTPGYGVFIAGAFALLGERLSSVTLAQHALGVLNAVLAYVLARSALPPLGALVVGLLTAVSGPLLLYEHYLMTETLSTTALLVALIALGKALEAGTLRWALLAGLAAGVGLLCRPALQIVLPVGVAALYLVLRQRARLAVVCCATFALAASALMLPWMIKNAVMYGSFSMAGPGRHLMFRLIRSDNGFTFARPIGDAAPESDQKAGARRILMEQAAKDDGSSNYQRFREELGLSEAEINTLQTELGLEAIRSRPLYYLGGTLGLFGYVFVGEPINLRREGSDLDEVDWERRIRHLVNPPPPRGDSRSAQQWLSLWDPARYGLIAPALFVLGIVGAAVRRRTQDGRTLILALVAVAPQLLGAAMAGFALRFRYPFDPLIATVAVAGVIYAWSALRRLGRAWVGRAKASTEHPSTAV